MSRLITTHRLRKVCQPSPIWQLTTPDQGGLPGAVETLVPSAWESIPGLAAYQGRGVYTRQLHCGGTLRFVFGGVSFRARVWLDDRLIATHYGAYTAFDCVVQDLPYGQHTLRIEADNRIGDDSALHVRNDYYNYGGVTRPVSIEQLGSAYLTRLHVTPLRRGRMWLAKITCSVRSLSDADQLIDVDAKAGPGSISWKRRMLPAGGEITLEATVAAPGVTPWSPGQPALYPAEAVLWLDGEPADDLCDRIGFREIRVDGAHLLLNGEQLFIKGVNRHEDYADFGCAVPVEAMMRDVQLMRGIGCNLVRTSHYPNDPRFLDLCDQMGLMVWEEGHARGLSHEQMQHPLFMKQTEACLREMVEQHRNHPSIILWGCLNECDDLSDEGAACYRACFELLRGLDGSRPVTAALLDRDGSRIAGASDVTSVNVYPEWYHDAPAATYVPFALGRMRPLMGEPRPLIISEIGAGALPGYHDPLARGKWTEERQADILRDQLTAAMQQPDLTGVIIWQLADVRVDESLFNTRPRCRNNKGLFDEYRRPKLAAATVRELWGK